MEYRINGLAIVGDHFTDSRYDRPVRGFCLSRGAAIHLASGVVSHVVAGRTVAVFMEHSIGSRRHGLGFDGVTFPGRHDLAGHHAFQVILHGHFIYQRDAGGGSDGFHIAAIAIPFGREGGAGTSGFERNLGSRFLAIDHEIISAFLNRELGTTLIGSDDLAIRFDAKISKPRKSHFARRKKSHFHGRPGRRVLGLGASYGSPCCGLRSRLGFCSFRVIYGGSCFRRGDRFPHSTADYRLLGAAHDYLGFLHSFCHRNFADPQREDR